jgi:hypothetical protein
MSMVDIPGGGFVIPAEPFLSPAPTGNANYVQDAANETVCAGIFDAPGGVIRTVGFNLATVTTIPTGNHDIRLETVDTTTGINSGSLISANANAALLLDTIGFKTVNLTADTTIARGTKVALVVRAPALNFGNIRIGTLQSFDNVFPYPVNTAGGKTAVMPNMVVLDTTGTALFTNTWPISATASNAFNSGTNPNRRGMRFKIPVSMRLAGAVLAIDADGDFDLVYYPDGVTATVMASVDKDIRAGTASGMMRFLFGTPVTIPINTYVRLVVVPTSVTNVTFTEYQVSSSAIMGAMPGGSNFLFTTVNGVPAAEGDWTNSTTSRMAGALIFDQVDVSSGGSSAHSAAFVG